MQGVRGFVTELFNNGCSSMVERSCMHNMGEGPKVSPTAGFPTQADEQERLRAAGRRKLEEFRARKAQATLASKCPTLAVTALTHHFLSSDALATRQASAHEAQQEAPSHLARSNSLAAPKDHHSHHSHTCSCPQGLPDLITPQGSCTLPQHIGFTKTPSSKSYLKQDVPSSSLLSTPLDAPQLTSIQTCASEPPPRPCSKLSITDSSCQRCPVCCQKLDPPLSPLSQQQGLLSHTGSRLSFQHQLLREVLGGGASLSTLPQPTTPAMPNSPPSPDTQSNDQQPMRSSQGLLADPLVEMLLTQVKELMRERGQLQAQVSGLQAQNAAMEELIGYLAEHQASECDEGEDRSEMAAGLPFQEHADLPAGEERVFSSPVAAPA